MTGVFKHEFIKNNDGVSSIEFALIIPLLILIFLGSVTTFDVLKNQNAAIRAADTMSDMIARDDVVTDLDIENAFEAGQNIAALENSHLFPGDVKVRIGYVERNRKDQLRLIWSRSRNTTDFTQEEIETMTFPPLARFGTVVITQVAYDYNTIFGTVHYGHDFNMSGEISKLSIQRPLFVEYINEAFEKNPKGG